MAKERAILEQKHVTTAIAEAHAKYSRFHDLFDGLTWLICRDPVPDSAIEIAPQIFVVKTNKIEYEGYCVITLVYSVAISDDDEQVIVIEDIKVEDV